jgi:hypothetical protein
MAARSKMISTRIDLTLVIAFASLSACASFADSAKSQVVARELRSENIARNKIGTSPVRKMVVYLPAG